MLGFTREELEQLSVSQLNKLVGYYKISVSGRKPTKQAYVNAVYDAMVANAPDANFIANSDGTNTPKYSVRLQRIMDMKEKGNS